MFFEASVTTSSPFILTSETLKIYQINNIVLDTKSQPKNIHVFVEYKGIKYLLCTLNKGDRDGYYCTFMFKVDTKKRQYKFTIEGDSNAKVSLIGFVEYEEDEEEEKKIIHKEERTKEYNQSKNKNNKKTASLSQINERLPNE